jgi:hypothetical protein
MRDLAEKSRRDSTSIRILTIITLIYLPCMAVSVSRQYIPRLLAKSNAEFLLHAVCGAERVVGRRRKTGIYEQHMALSRCRYPFDPLHHHRMVRMGKRSAAAPCTPVGSEDPDGKTTARHEDSNSLEENSQTSPVNSTAAEIDCYHVIHDSSRAATILLARMGWELCFLCRPTWSLHDHLLLASYVAGSMTIAVSGRDLELVTLYLQLVIF